MGSTHSECHIAQQDNLPPPSVEAIKVGVAKTSHLELKRTRHDTSLRNRVVLALARMHLLSVASASTRPRSPEVDLTPTGNGVPGLPQDFDMPHLTEDGSDPFPDRAKLYAELRMRPPYLRRRLQAEGLPPDTWYIGPLGFTMLDVMIADKEEHEHYERIVKLITYDRNRFDKAVDAHSEDQFRFSS